MKRSLYVMIACIGVATMVALSGCGTTKIPAPGLSADVDAACGGSSWRRRHAFSADITVHRTGHPDIDGQVLYDIRANRLVLQLPVQGGGVASFGVDGNRLWRNGPLDLDYADWTRVLQWAAWVSVPYRLTDPSLDVREIHPVSVAGATYRVAQIERPSEGPGLCVLFVAPDDLRPRGAVPFCGARNVVRMQTVYALAYERFDLCNDVIVPSRWSVWPWDARNGVSTAGPVASVALTNLQFVDPDPSIFESPASQTTLGHFRPQVPVRFAHLTGDSCGTP